MGPQDMWDTLAEYEMMIQQGKVEFNNPNYLTFALDAVRDCRDFKFITSGAGVVTAKKDGSVIEV